MGVCRGVGMAAVLLHTALGQGPQKSLPLCSPLSNLMAYQYLFLKVFGVKPLFQKGLAGVRGRAPRAPVPHKPQCFAIMQSPVESTFTYVDAEKDQTVSRLGKFFLDRQKRQLRRREDMGTGDMVRTNQTVSRSSQMNRG